ncbi:hypothetical protein [Desulfosarcina ovata]|uniref:Uncharacterized protein n=1 Tax=Desulfosarcina ovata subsp. ovata TaxID=2752305 RepID=A0A5K8AMN4_9BACT|nr:hypothetical protein [Desulfosarcina ovata]BBO93110.1 hypothetical protein DSCOOX_62900 [Desulfosarcina ovata subsp. ovata]
MKKTVRRLGLSVLLIGCVLHPLAGLGEDNEPMLQRLFSWMRPFGHYEGRLSDAVAKSTQKSGMSDTLSRVFLVGADSSAIIEWIPGRGADDLVTCPDGHTVFLRRGKVIEVADFKGSGNELRIPDTATPITGIRVKTLYGCITTTPETVNGQSLWIEREAGTHGLMDYADGRLKDRPLPRELQAYPPETIGSALRKLQGIRADSRHAWVRDQKLLLGEAGNDDRARIVDSDFPFSGYPAWLGYSDILMVIGLMD